MVSKHEYNWHIYMFELEHEKRELQNVNNQIKLTSNNTNACAKVDMSFNIVLFLLVQWQKVHTVEKYWENNQF